MVKNTRGAVGRKSKYETHVKSRFDEISEWLNLGAPEKEIWTNLGIHKSTFYDYKSKHKEFSDLLKKGRKKPVNDIKAAMLKRAKGFQYEEKKVITQRIEYEDGEVIIPARLVRTEITTKTALPDTAAGLVLLQHWDLDEKGKPKWSRDPASREIKQRELELKEKQAENDAW